MGHGTLMSLRALNSKSESEWCTQNCRHFLWQIWSRNVYTRIAKAEGKKMGFLLSVFYISAPVRDPLPPLLGSPKLYPSFKAQLILM